MKYSAAVDINLHKFYMHFAILKEMQDYIVGQTQTVLPNNISPVRCASVQVVLFFSQGENESNNVVESKGQM